MDTPQPGGPDDLGTRLLARLREDLTGASADATERMRRAVSDGTAHRGAHRPDGPPSAFAVRVRRRPALAAAGAALALTGLAAGAVVVGHSPAPPGRAAHRPTGAPSPTAPATTGAARPGADVLLLAAQHANAAPVPTVHTGQYVYVRTESNQLVMENARNPGAPGALVRVRSRSVAETWLDPNGMLAVRVRGVDGIDPRPATPGDRAAAERLGLLGRQPVRYDESAAQGRNGVASLYARGRAELAAEGPSLHRPTPEYLAGLPTDPAGLLAVLRSDVAANADLTPGGTEPDGLFVLADIANVFMTAGPAVPPDLRAALYRVAATLPGVHRVPGEVTVAGHRAIAVVNDPVAGKRQMEILLDPATYQFVGTRSQAGTPEESWQVVTAAGVVDSLGQTP